ncbi:MAG: class I SAM-dependent methyltransferase [Candidatus Bathyarchaeota archaeon]
MENILSNLHGKTILDLGCGDGWISQAIHEKQRFDVLSVDLSKQALEKCKRRDWQSNLTLTQSSADFLPFKNDLFDTIICLETVMYVPHLELAIDEISRVLKKGGFLLISVPNYLTHGIVYDLIQSRFMKFLNPNLQETDNIKHNFTFKSLKFYFNTRKFKFVKHYNSSFLNFYISSICCDVLGFKCASLEKIEKIDVKAANKIHPSLSSGWLIIFKKF